MKKMDMVIENVIHGVALEPADFDRLLFFLVHHAGTFAKNFGRANAPAAMSQNIGLEDYARRATQIIGGDLLDECGNVNARRTRDSARSVKTEKTARGFHGGLARRQPRRYFGKILLVLLRSQFWRGLAHGHELSRPSLGLERSHSSTGAYRAG
jgi:hypothetical protein